MQCCAYYTHLSIFQTPCSKPHFQVLPRGRTHRGLSVGRRRSFVPYNYCLLEAASRVTTEQATALHSPLDCTALVCSLAQLRIMAAFEAARASLLYRVFKKST